MIGEAGHGDGRGWLSAHLHYQGSHDLLLTDLVAPLLDEARAQSALEGYFFLRHWQGGPHVRLRLRARGSDELARLEGLLAERAAAFFARCPSPDHLDEAGYARMARALHALEPDLAPTSLAANNSCQLVPYLPEQHKYGRGPALEAVERHFGRSSDLCLEVLRGGAPLAQRLTLAIGAVVAAAWDGEADGGTVAARLERSRRAWGRMTGLAGRREQQVHDAYRTRQSRLRALALAVCRPAGADLGHAFLDGWRSSLDRLRAELAALAPAGASPPGQATTVILDHCVHLACNRLGVPPRNEWFARSLACLAALDLWGGETDAADQLRRQLR